MRDFRHAMCGLAKSLSPSVSKAKPAMGSTSRWNVRFYCGWWGRSTSGGGAAFGGAGGSHDVLLCV